MPILFNFKICDNAPECNGIRACPVKAITWDEEQKTLVVDNSKCTSCGACAKSCPVSGAILVAKTEEEFEKIKNQVEDDLRTRAELLKDRYGVAPTDFNLILTMANFNKEILETDRVVIVDFWDRPHMPCRIFSIPFESILPKKTVISEIMKMKNLKDLKFKFKKIDIEKNPEIAKRYNIEEIPSLLIFWKGKAIGRIEGRIKTDKEEELRNKIGEILKKIEV
jgi:NAD-dependent dihydropyrimidine dehydrogenase PreA subunit/thiol-disulfide isomerase/thioredoxin